MKTFIMKKSFRRLALIALPVFLIIVACHKSNNSAPTPTPTPSTPLQTYIANDTSLSIYQAAIVKANAEDRFKGTDSETVLIPTNDAFRAAGISQATINSMTQSQVDSLLRYHIISPAAALADSSYKSFTSSLGNPIYGMGGTNSYFNGATATKATVTGSAATVYRLNTPLAVPFATGQDFLNSDTSYTFYNAALRRSGYDLSTDTGFTTVLVPTNNAFRAAGIADTTAISEMDSATLRHILMYHVLQGQYFTNSYNGITTAPTVAGSNVTIGTSANGATFAGPGNSAPVGFAGSNQLAGTNTIYQPVNGVLTP
jgi:uncharacterized surface protein with fasciclin (FAS1) repeats